MNDSERDTERDREKEMEIDRKTQMEKTDSTRNIILRSVIVVGASLSRSTALSQPTRE